MNMNFSLAFQKLSVPPESQRTVFRYDDTNPEAESKEYIDSLAKDVAWLGEAERGAKDRRLERSDSKSYIHIRITKHILLVASLTAGWEPEKTTFSSDNFDVLEECAVKLIKKGKAYVCFLAKAEIEMQREICKKRVGLAQNGKDPDKELGVPDPNLYPGKYRDTSVDENLKHWSRMKSGFYPSGSCTLRMKMDLTSPNPNMHDLMAYRIKYTSHPHAGPGRCVYPSYDFAHCICDSLER